MGTNNPSEEHTAAVIEEILAYARSPEGRAAQAAQAAREARCPAIKVQIPEHLHGQFTEELKVLASKKSPWVRDIEVLSQDGDRQYTERALLETLIKGRECALRLNPAQVRKLYDEKHKLGATRPLAEEQIFRLHELNVITDGHPLAVNIDIAMLMCDSRLDNCGYALADWLPLDVEQRLQSWRKDCDHNYGVPWVDLALRK